MAEETNVPEPTDLIPVMRHHLAEMLLALEAAYGKAQAEDLVEGYREGKLLMQPSRLTRQLSIQQARIESYLTINEEDEDELPRE